MLTPDSAEDAKEIADMSHETHPFDVILHETAHFDKDTVPADATESAMSSTLRHTEQGFIDGTLVYGNGAGLCALSQLQEMRTELKKLRTTGEQLKAQR